MPNPNGSRAECTLIGVSTLPNCRRVKKYASFIIKPLGFSIGERNVSISNGPFSIPFNSSAGPARHAVPEPVCAATYSTNGEVETGQIVSYGAEYTSPPFCRTLCLALYPFPGRPLRCRKPRRRDHASSFMNICLLFAFSLE